MKKSWLIIFILIILIFTAGCSTTSSSTTLNSIIPKNTEIAQANFCVGSSLPGDKSITFQPPLVQAKLGVNSVLEMPLEPGRYKIIVTTSTPESVVELSAYYKEFSQNDKFGNPIYYDKTAFSVVESNRYNDINKELLIPNRAIEGHIMLFGRSGSREGNCGTLIVTRLT